MKIKFFFIYVLLMTVYFSIWSESPGFLVKTVPPGAEVFFDGRKLGETPLIITPETMELPLFVNPGKSYNFIIYKEFFEGEIVSLKYNDKKNEVINLNLQYLPRLPLYTGKFQVGVGLDLFQLLMSSSYEDLLHMKAEIYAKYGKKLEPEYFVYIDGLSWYKENPYYSEEFINDTDIKNLEIIDKIMNPSSTDLEIIDAILNNIEYHSGSGDQLMNMQMIFSDENMVTVYNQNYQGDMYEPQEEETFKWKVVDGKVYIWNYTLFVFNLNHETKNIDGYYLIQ